jgi:hypothetical protein
MQRASAADAVKMTFDVIDDLFFGDGWCNFSLSTSLGSNSH